MYIDILSYCTIDWIPPQKEGAKDENSYSESATC